MSYFGSNANFFLHPPFRKIQPSAPYLNWPKPQGKSRCEVGSRLPTEVKGVPRSSPCSRTVLHSRALPLLSRMLYCPVITEPVNKQKKNCTKNSDVVSVPSPQEKSLLCS